MACRGCRSGRSQAGATFNRTGPVATLGNKTRTFGHRIVDQAPLGRGVTIQTGPRQRNNAEPSHEVLPAPPPCPQIPGPPLTCAPVGVRADQLKSYCTELDTQWKMDQSFTMAAGFDGGSFSFAEGRLILVANVPTGFANYAQIIGRVAPVNPSLEQFCLCFDVHATIVQATRLWKVGLLAAAPDAIAPSVLVVPNESLGTIQVVFSAGGTTTFNIPVGSVPGLHSVRLCHLADVPGADPKNYTVQIDGGAIVPLSVPALSVPNIPLPISLLTETFFPSAFSAIADFGPVCLQAV